MFSLFLAALSQILTFNLLTEVCTVSDAALGTFGVSQAGCTSRTHPVTSAEIFPVHSSILSNCLTLKDILMILTTQTRKATSSLSIVVFGTSGKSHDLHLLMTHPS